MLSRQFALIVTSFLPLGCLLEKEPPLNHSGWGGWEPALDSPEPPVCVHGPVLFPLIALQLTFCVHLGKYFSHHKARAL